MSLPYCPNCRAPISDSDLGWICWRTYPHVVPIDAASQEAERAARDIYGSETTVQDVFREEDELCKTYNQPGEKICANEQCKGARMPETAVVACPNCKTELPDIDNMSPRTLTITGPSGSGKTYFIVALHDWWKNRLGRFGLTTMTAMGSRVEDLFKDFRRRVRQGIKLPATPKSQVFSFSWLLTPPLNSGLDTLLFTLPDVSGEKLLTVEGLARNRHYHHTSGIVLLLDGDGVATAQNFDVDYRGQEGDHAEVVQAMIKDFQRRRLPPEEIRALPIAVCINKMDVLCRLDARWDDLMLREPQHNGGFDYQACYGRSEAIRTILHEYDETASVAHLIEHNFDNLMFFGVATLGSDREPPTYKPKSVEDPFLYLMWHLGYVGLAPGQ